jgi:hypothetical protein
LGALFTVVNGTAKRAGKEFMPPGASHCGEWLPWRRAHQRQ